MTPHSRAATPHSAKSASSKPETASTTGTWRAWLEPGSRKLLVLSRGTVDCRRFHCHPPTRRSLAAGPLMHRTNHKPRNVIAQTQAHAETLTHQASDRTVAEVEYNCRERPDPTYLHPPATRWRRPEQRKLARSLGGRPCTQKLARLSLPDLTSASSSTLLRSPSSSSRPHGASQERRLVSYLTGK